VYSSDVITSTATDATISRAPPKLNNAIDISMAADLLANNVEPESSQNKGGDTIETYQWLAQVGAARLP
jgi:hypothetical protein